MPNTPVGLPVAALEGASVSEEPEIDESPPFDPSAALRTGFDQRNTEADAFA